MEASELPFLTLVIEREVKPNRWRPVLGPLRDLDCPEQLLHQLYSTEAEGVPSDIGQDTVRHLFIPLKRETTLDDEGEIIGISKEDAQHEVDSWGAVKVDNYLIFATQEDFTTLDSSVFQDMINEVEGAEEFDFVQASLEQIDSLKDEGLSPQQIRLILVMS